MQPTDTPQELESDSDSLPTVYGVSSPEMLMAPELMGVESQAPEVWM